MEIRGIRNNGFNGHIFSFQLIFFPHTSRFLHGMTTLTVLWLTKFVSFSTKRRVFLTVPSGHMGYKVKIRISLEVYIILKCLAT